MQQRWHLSSLKIPHFCGVNFSVITSHPLFIFAIDVSLLLTKLLTKHQVPQLSNMQALSHASLGVLLQKLNFMMILGSLTTFSEVFVHFEACKVVKLECLSKIIYSIQT